MNITITGKELKATDAIKDYIEEKLARIKKNIFFRTFWSLSKRARVNI